MKKNVMCDLFVFYILKNRRTYCALLTRQLVLVNACDVVNLALRFEYWFQKKKYYEQHVTLY